MISKKCILLISVTMLIQSSVYAQILSINAKLIVKVTDELNQPVQNAKVTVGFSQNLSDKKYYGMSDKNGMFMAEGEGTPLGGISVDMEGYYQSNLGIEFKNWNRITRRFEPWGKTYEIVLKKKQNPVPMFAKSDVAKIPLFDKPVGYDLEIGDWVTPYGGGSVADFIFNFHCDRRSLRDFDCSYEMSFTNEKDGIQPYKFAKDDHSYYRWPVEAPTDGYESSKSGARSRRPNGTSHDTTRDINYIFRVRSVANSNGTITSARYGKILGDIKFHPAKIEFTYYFNPDGTRNLEFDPEQNLFKFSRDEFMNKVDRP